MYIPKKFSATVEQLTEFIDENGFACLITQTRDQWFSTMVPILVETRSPLTLKGHMARANLHWKHLSDSESIMIFQGPHAYVSPAWYTNTQEVPTWNYAMARTIVTGTLIQNTDSLNRLVIETIDKYEAGVGNPWDRVIDQGYWRKQLKHIVGFRLTVCELTGKFKLGQNRSVKDQKSLSTALEREPSAVGLWNFMTKKNKA